MVLLMALLFTALAVDTGRLWFERRQLQSIADIAALEAAKDAGCGGNAGSLLADAQAAAARNGFAGSLADAPNRVEVGGLATVAGLRKFTAGTTLDAVHVVVNRTVPASLVLGGLFGNNVTIMAEATAQADPSQAIFSAGSYLLRIDTTTQDVSLLNSLIGGLLGGSLSLDAVAYKGLASTEVNLAQLLQASATVGSVDELLTADLTVAQVLGLTATALSRQTALDASVTAGLQTLLSADMNDLNVKLGDVLNVAAPGSEAAATAGINVFDLITTTILVANKQHAVSMPVAVNLPGLLSVNAQIDIIQPPQIAVGPAGINPATGQWCTQTRTAQLDVRVAVNAPLLGLADVDLGLGVQLAQGSAHLNSLVLAPGKNQAVIGARSGIASIVLTNAANTGPATIKLLGLTLANIGVNIPIQPAHDTDLVYDVSTPVADHLPMMQSINSSLGDSLGSALSNPNAITIELLPDLLGGLLDSILSPILSVVVGPLLGTIGSSLLDPLLKLLGIQVGGLDVTLQNIIYRSGAQLVI